MIETNTNTETEIEQLKQKIDKLKQLPQDYTECRLALMAATARLHRLQQISNKNEQCRDCDHREKCPYPDELELVTKGLVACSYHTNQASHDMTKRIFVQPYRPREIAVEAYTQMQAAAKASNMSLLEIARALGYSCPYDWQKAIERFLEGKSGINPIPALPVWNGKREGDD